ncbi:hypothetical protein Q31a_26940 [Aureliella helgolandensis]|uniref:Uncharacterized protein n=1 Tax=Aureliella helgolandensis TaxID=2527968 RepID=A0A518G707_9BACT|nr:hypothetical protein Q31a_26940 [Aureliella helgolandensis]
MEEPASRKVVKSRKNLIYLVVSLQGKPRRERPAVEAILSSFIVEFVNGGNLSTSNCDRCARISASVGRVCDRVVIKDYAIRIAGQSLDILCRSSEIIINSEAGQRSSQKLMLCHAVKQF